MSEENQDVDSLPETLESWLRAFIDWVPYEEEREEWENVFFQEHFPHLPEDIVGKIKSHYCLDYLKSLEPFSLRLAPTPMRLLIRAIHNSVFSQ